MGAENVIDFRVAIRTTVLLVDDDTRHLDLRALTLKMYGFSVVNVTTPQEAISVMNENPSRKIDVAVLDYHMPVTNGCVLAEYLKARYPTLKIVLYSGTLEIPEHEMISVDAFVPKADGIRALLVKVAGFGQNASGSCPFLAIENRAAMDAVN